MSVESILESIEKLTLLEAAELEKLWKKNSAFLLLLQLL